MKNSSKIPSKKKFSFFYLIIFVLFFAIPSRGQGLANLFCDLGGTQPVLVDTNGFNGLRSPLISGNAKGQLGFGLKYFEMSAKRNLHLGFIVSYRNANISNLIPGTTKKTVWEFLVGATYLRRKPIMQSEKLATHFELTGMVGIGNSTLASNVSAGFVILNKEGVSGIAIEFVYRPYSYSYPNISDVLVHDPYFITLSPSYSLRLALTFGKGLNYE